MKRRSGGFTLMELMVVLAIAASVLVIGAPSFNTFRLNNRLTNAANDALAAITKARTEAIKRQGPVSMCASAAPNAATPACTDGATAGFIVFNDPNNNCLRESTEDMLSSAVYEVSFSNTNPLRIKSNGNCISFAATGFRQDIASRTTLSHLVFCDNRGVALQVGTTQSAGRGISLARTGRARISRITSGSGVANGQGLAEDLSTWSDATCP